MLKEISQNHTQTKLPPRKKVGLALSGGVGRIAAHIGVLEVLEREGIPIDCVAGSSAGALIGGLYCAGLTVEYMKEMAGKIGWQSMARPVFSRQGFLSFDLLERWIIDQVGDLHFADLSLGPFAVVATDMEAGVPVVLKEGPIAPAIRASCSVPGFVVPAKIDGRLLGDGGVSNNLPVSVARELGADYVIGVDLFVPTVRRKLGPFGFGFAAIETLVRRSQGGVDTTDCLITPDLAGRSYVDLSKRHELIELGAKATEAKLPEIRAELAI